MEGTGGRQSRILGRLLGKLRGDHHKINALDKRFSITSSGRVADQWRIYSMSESTGCDSITNDDEDIELGTSSVPQTSSSAPIDDPGQFVANIDLRYGGQYLTPEQLPEFCDQLRHLVEVIRNIQSYSRVTGEYPSKLEHRLEDEAREVASLAAEARNARDVVARARVQRRAVRAHKKHLLSHLANLRENEARELESTVRLSDKKLYKSWEVLKDSTDPSAFEPLLNEVKNKQTALDCLVHLIEGRLSVLARTSIKPQPLPPPEPKDHEDTTTGVAGRKRYDGTARRNNCKRKRKDNTREPRSVPLSVEPSRHAPTHQVTLFIQDNESTSRYRVGSAGAVALAPLELSSGGSVRDILFFTTN